MTQKLILSAFAGLLLAAFLAPSSNSGPTHSKADTPECQLAIVKNFKAHIDSQTYGTVLTTEYADKLNDQLNSACGTNY